MRRFTVLGGVVAAVLLVAGGCIPPDPPPPDSTVTITVGGEDVTVLGPDGSTVSVEVADPVTLPVIASSFSLGALDIDVSGVAAGAVVQVTVELQNPVNTVRKLIGGSWDRFLHDGTTGATISADGKTVTLDLVDGGRGDTDGVANGVVVDPVLLGYDAGVVPTLTDGVPFSHQLQSTGGTGPVTWSVLSGTLPAGITLDPSGLLSGTPGADPYIGLVRVEATDGVTSATKLLVLFTLEATTQLVSTGVPLPEAGTSIAVADWGASADPYWVGQYGSDGTLERFETFSPATLGSLVAATTDPDTTMMLSFPTPPATGVDIIDPDTGAPITNLGPSPTYQYSGGYFSPNGDHLALPDWNSGTTWVFDTSTWALERTIPTVLSSPAPGGSPWRPDSTELMSFTSSNPLEIAVFSATNPAADRSVTIPGRTCSQVSDWSATNRFAFSGCTFPGPLDAVFTASAVDGSDVRVVVPACDFNVAPCSGGLYARFSPTGGSLVMMAITMSTTPTPTASLVVGSDTPDATLTAITEETSFGNFLIPLSWRNGG